MDRNRLFLFCVGALVASTFFGAGLSLFENARNRGPGPLAGVSNSTEAAQPRIANDGMTRIDNGSGDVAIYRDNKTGCEWFSIRGGHPEPRTAAPNKDGVRVQICSTDDGAVIPTVQPATR